MSCDNSTYSTSIVDLARYSSLVLEVGDYPKVRETDVGRNKSLKQCRSGPTGDQSKSRGRGHEVRSRIIPDSTQTDPEHVWGDEGPVND